MYVPFVTELALPLSAGVAFLPRFQIFLVLSTSRGTLQQLQSKVCGEEGACVQNTRETALPLSEGVGNFCFSSLGQRGHVVLPHTSYFLFWAGFYWVLGRLQSHFPWEQWGGLICAQNNK